MGMRTWTWAGVELNPKNGKIITTNEQTNVPHIFAIGDVR